MSELITTDAPSELDKDEVKLRVLEQLARIKEELTVEHPQIDEYLMDISQNLKLFPDLTHILTDEEIAPLYHALLSKSNVRMEVKKSRAKKGSKGLLSDGSNPAAFI